MPLLLNYEVQQLPVGHEGLRVRDYIQAVPQLDCLHALEFTNKHGGAWQPSQTLCAHGICHGSPITLLH